MSALPVRKARDDRRRAILDVASDLFLQEGYAAASMSAIAAKLGGSKATLYNYFPSKKSLFVALMEDAGEDQDWLIFPPEADDLDVRGVLYNLGLKFLDFILGENARSTHRLVVAEAARFPELGRVFYENGPKRSLDVLTEWLRTQMRAGRLREADPERAATLFFVLCKSELYQKALWAVEPDPSREIRVSTVRSAVEVFFRVYGVDHDVRR